ncbi:unnamed protein product [Gadus morhua 'NCC']
MRTVQSLCSVDVPVLSSVSLEREEWLDPEESLGASDQWATWGFRELKASREVRELWETQDFQVRPVSVEDLVRGPLQCGYTGTMEATTLVLLVLLDCLLVLSSRPFRSSSGGPPMVCNFIKSDVEES